MYYIVAFHWNWNGILWKNGASNRVFDMWSGCDACLGVYAMWNDAKWIIFTCLFFYKYILQSFYTSVTNARHWWNISTHIPRLPANVPAFCTIHQNQQIQHWRSSKQATENKKPTIQQINKQQISRSMQRIRDENKQYK